MEDVSWAACTSLLLDAALHDSGVEIAELLAAGVPERRIRSLYPAEPAAYIEGIKCALLSDVKRPLLYELLRHKDFAYDLFTYAPSEVYSRVRRIQDQAQAIGWLHNIPQAADDPTHMLMTRTIQNVHVLVESLQQVQRYPFEGMYSEYQAHYLAHFEIELPAFRGTCERMLEILVEKSAP